MRGRAARAVPLALVLAASLAGCGRYYWSRPGATAEEFYRDSQACARESSRPTATAVDIGIDEGRYRACLRARGYVRDKRGTPPPSGWYRGIE